MPQPPVVLVAPVHPAPACRRAQGVTHPGDVRIERGRDALHDAPQAHGVAPFPCHLGRELAAQVRRHPRRAAHVQVHPEWRCHLGPHLPAAHGQARGPLLQSREQRRHAGRTRRLRGGDQSVHGTEWHIRAGPPLPLASPRVLRRGVQCRAEEQPVDATGIGEPRGIDGCEYPQFARDARRVGGEGGGTAIVQPVVGGVQARRSRPLRRARGASRDVAPGQRVERGVGTALRDGVGWKSERQEQHESRENAHAANVRCITRRRPEDGASTRRFRFAVDQAMMRGLLAWPVPPTRPLHS